MEEVRNAHKVSDGKHEGKRPLGRPRCRCENNIKMDVKGIELPECLSQKQGMLPRKTGVGLHIVPLSPWMRVQIHFNKSQFI
jgi:hypothetical protein